MAIGAERESDGLDDLDDRPFDPFSGRVFLDLLAHYRLEAVADVLRVRGIEVVHILDTTHAVVHCFTSPARIVQGRLTYAPAKGEE